MSKKIRILEVGPRDGLQNESVNLSHATRKELIKKLFQVGLQNIEVGAFVSPHKVPQMKGSKKLIQDLLKSKAMRQARFSALVPNMRGLEDALESGIGEIAIFGSSTETFSQKNINCSIAESFKRFKKVIDEAHKNKIKVRGYLSTVFYCPYEGKTSATKVIRLTKQLLDMGIYEVSLGDTIGAANPKEVEVLLNKLIPQVGEKKIAMHFHDTRGTAVANVLKSVEMGIRTFDSSIGGLGGCPYAPGAQGNVATEDIVFMLHGMGYKTGIDLKKAIKVSQWISKKMKKPLPSRVGRAGLPKV